VLQKEFCNTICRLLHFGPKWIRLEATMHPIGDSIGEPALDFEEWRVLIQSFCGRYNPEGIEPSVFAGWVHPFSLWEFLALDIGSNAQRIERTKRDVRLDGMEYYAAVFQLAGRSAISQNDQIVSLAVGESALVDATRPLTYLSSDENTQWNCLSIQLPRQSLVSHLGFEPQGGICRRGTLAGHLLLDIFRNADNAERTACASADPYMRLAIYDLVGALFAPSDPWPTSRHADRLFARIRNVVMDRFTDPYLRPRDVAAELGISVRYLQKLFTLRGSTCSDFIQSLRLDHAVRLLHRRALTKASQPLSEIAYTCGFRDYSYFAQQFRRRFGHAPSAHSDGDGRRGNRTVRTSNGESAA
jgi:AraC family transcriptional regulator, positive regulator of tynA and feaB